MFASLFNQTKIMKNKFLLFAILGITISATMTSCTKEQMTINLLYGTWKLDSQLENNGTPVTYNNGTSVEEFRTFYRCDNKQSNSCVGATKTTTVATIGGSTVTTIDGRDFSYSVFDNSQLIINGTLYEIESVKKGSLSFHPVEHPLATSTYSK
jgi:hypothetical protein